LRKIGIIKIAQYFGVLLYYILSSEIMKIGNEKRRPMGAAFFYEY
jgi:hypothetical protein